MTFLFILTQAAYTRHFEGVILELAERGHHVRIATEREAHAPLRADLAAHPRISHTTCAGGRRDRWRNNIQTLRALSDYMHYLEPPFQPAGKLRARAFRRLAKSLTGDERTHIKLKCRYCGDRVVDDDVRHLLAPALGHAGMDGFTRLLAQIERTVPADEEYQSYLRAERPDAVLVCPLVNLGCAQADWVKAAQAAGIRVGYPVFSWDNLTTKGIIHVKPDRVFVWNAIQRKEAVEYHGMDDDEVVVTGAPRFDEFFEMTPSASREEFCHRLRLDASQPVVTYLCSSEFVAGREVDFVKTWVGELRRDARLRSCSVLIRPHPRTIDHWRDVDVRKWPGATGVAVAASPGMNADQTLYDTLFFSAAVVGLNTSAQIEAGILGKPVFTMLAPGFELGQQGTLHFQYLLAANGGFVDVADTFDQHRDHLASAVSGRHDRSRINRFIESFIRPAGLSRPVTPIMVDALEAFAS